MFALLFVCVSEAGYVFVCKQAEGGGGGVLVEKKEVEMVGKWVGVGGCMKYEG